MKFEEAHERGQARLLTQEGSAFVAWLESRIEDIPCEQFEHTAGNE